MTKNITPEHSKMIMQEMCRRVGITGQQFDDFSFIVPDWYLSHSWTEEEQNAFILWLADFLEKHKYCPKNGKKRGMRWAEYEASKMNLAFGWTTVPKIDTKSQATENPDKIFDKEDLLKCAKKANSMQSATAKAAKKIK